MYVSCYCGDWKGSFRKSIAAQPYAGQWVSFGKLSKEGRGVWGMPECVCAGFIQGFKLREKGGGGTPKFGVDMEGVYSI